MSKLPSVGDEYEKWLRRKSGPARDWDSMPTEAERDRERAAASARAERPEDAAAVNAAGFARIFTPGNVLFRPAAQRAPPKKEHEVGRVAIIGGGMAGLYAGLLLQKQNVKFKIFEKNQDRSGGRIFTHFFESAPGGGKNQYFEAGAMRIPKTHKEVLDLIDYVNSKLSAKEDKIKLIKYHFTNPNNRVFVNGTTEEDGKVMTRTYAQMHPEKLGFPSKAKAYKTADEYVDEIMLKLLKEFCRDINKFFDKYDKMSMYYYLSAHEGWDNAKINYVEVMTSNTHAFQNSLVQQVMEYQEFHPTTAGDTHRAPPWPWMAAFLMQPQPPQSSGPQCDWSTIEGGMYHLPRACEIVLGSDNVIKKGVTVTGISKIPRGRILIKYASSNNLDVTYQEAFDKVIFAIPANVLRMMNRPTWSAEKEEAIRSCNVSPLHKIGLRFKRRFWEKGDRKIEGGQSISDVPSRWFVYPSNGIGEDGPGVLLGYCWGGDAGHWIPTTKKDQEVFALRDLKKIHPEVKDLEECFIESFCVKWAEHWSTGLSSFLPGQFSHLFDPLLEPEENKSIFFAGEHCSHHHGWILGALQSAVWASSQLLDTRLQYLKTK